MDILFLFLIFIFSIMFDLLIGEFPSKIHPVVWMGNYIRKASALADRATGSFHRFIGGAAVVVSGAAVFYLAAAVLSLAATLSNTHLIITVAGTVCCFFIIKSTYSLSGLIKAARSVHNALQAADIGEARRLTSMHLVSRNTSTLNAGEISAAVIESVSENLTDSVISPWFFLLAGGPAASAAYRFVNTCDSMMGYRNEKYEWLGKFAARADDVLNFIPARIAGFLIVFAAAVSRNLSGRNALKTMLAEHRVTESPNAGWTMAAAAGALGVRLEKRGCYSIVGGTDLPSKTDIMDAVGLVRISTAMAFAVFTCVVLLCSGILI